MEYDCASALSRLSELLSLPPNHPDKVSVTAALHRLHLAWWRAAADASAFTDWPDWVTAHLDADDLDQALSLSFGTRVPQTPAHKADVVSRFHNAANALNLSPEAMFLWLGRDVPLKAASTKLLSSLINGRGSTFSASHVLAAVRAAANARHNDHLLPPEPMSIDVTKASKSLKQPQPQPQVVVEEPSEPEIGLPEPAVENFQPDPAIIIPSLESPPPGVPVPVPAAASPLFDPPPHITNAEFLHDDVEMTDAPPAMVVTQHPDGSLSFEYQGLDPAAARFLSHVIELSKLDVPLQLRGSGTWASCLAITTHAHATVEAIIHSGVDTTFKRLHA
ncbi:hypothetical protein CORC01_06624 [Colletotrichum orchidophilum]|uniref:Uncharacterized protein n=1 Tax=Colletotrichum orchidophilum TaxID=1209926 RepID=A0A1G4B9M2_9PEZI|nr:uncharacterized protein CORC01_06624 [Colletotrichum orchidophilum]OHE98110.1 hypothetical protein CORC01_06624 [Colletotrichum orchidophilum]